MPNAEEEFEKELKVFQAEVEESIFCFYAWLTVHDHARRTPATVRFLNQHASFWNTALGALQANSLIALGRIFDTDPRSHGIQRLLNLSKNNSEVFSKAALAKRKQKISTDSSKWLDEYMQSAYVPKLSDFRRLAQYTNVHRTIYRTKYEPLRNKYFAHRDRVNLAGVFAATNIHEIERMLVFLLRLGNALWNLFHNGTKPSLRPARYSARRMVQFHQALRNGPPHELMTKETLALFQLLTQSSLSPR